MHSALVQERCQRVRKRLSVLAEGIFELAQRWRNGREAKRTEWRYIALVRATNLFVRLDAFVWWWADVAVPARAEVGRSGVRGDRRLRRDGRSGTRQPRRVRARHPGAPISRHTLRLGPPFLKGCAAGWDALRTRRAPARGRGARGADGVSVLLACLGHRRGDPRRVRRAARLRVYKEEVVSLLGADPERHVALGMGIGLDRLACVHFQVADIRQLSA